jgi:hypothetical protein
MRLMYKVNISKLSVQNTKLMVGLANSIGRQDSLETQLSEAVALGSYKLWNDESPSKAEKLRQKTRKRLLSLQGKEAEDITDDSTTFSGFTKFCLILLNKHVQRLYDV